MEPPETRWVGYGELIVTAEIAEDPSGYLSPTHMVREVVAERLDADPHGRDVIVDDLPTPAEAPQWTRDGLAYAAALRGRVRTTPITDVDALDDDAAARRSRARFKASESAVARWLEGDDRIRWAQVTIRPGDLRQDPPQRFAA